MAASISLNDEPAPIEKLIHDLAIPLSIMKLNLELLKRNNNPDYLKRLNLGWEKIDLILKQRTSYRVHRSSKYLSDLIDEAIELFGSGIAQAGISVTKEYKVDCKIDRHQDKMIRIIINIFHNALEALDKYHGKRQIIINTSLKARYYRISIFNSGLGFPENIIKDLGQCPISNKGRNRGKGVYNCSQLIRKYFQGRIIFQNPARGGAQVLILIPQYILENE